MNFRYFTLDAPDSWYCDEALQYWVEKAPVQIGKGKQGQWNGKEMMAKQRKRSSLVGRLCQGSRSQKPVISQSLPAHTVYLKLDHSSFEFKYHCFYICRTLGPNWFLCHPRSSCWNIFFGRNAHFSENLHIFVIFKWLNLKLTLWIFTLIRWTIQI